MKKLLRLFCYGATILFAVIGVTFTAVFVGTSFNLFTVQGSSELRNAHFSDTSSNVHPKTGSSCVQSVDEPWQTSEEWTTMREAFKKDASHIHHAALRASTSPRLIIATIAPEQFRFFTSEREVFKRYFEPLKILGTMTQFSYGIAGIKPRTAESIERHLMDSNSPYYLGNNYEKVLASTTKEAQTLRFERITDEKNPYYSYLYVSLFIKQIQRAWEIAGYPIHNDAGTIATLYNIGFEHSHPKQNPSHGGSSITLGGRQYSYGLLASQVYCSPDLIALFPN